MKAFVVVSCLLAVAAASPQFAAYSYLASPYHSFVYSPLVHYPKSGAVVPADAPDVAAAKVAHFAAHAAALSRGKRSPQYYGPPAPLNADGTVAQTPEVAAAAAYQQAAHAHEARRLADAAALAAAHPDTTSPAQSWNPAPAAPAQSWNSPAPQQWGRSAWSSAPVQPAPLNADGTVAQTREYQAIAASHAAAHYGRKRRSVALNPDGTVAPTPEVAAATAEHLAAKARAVGYPLPLVASPYTFWSGLPYYGRYYAAGAPLNFDGTVAHTPEYLAVAASHAAAHHEALARSRRSVSLNPDGTVAPTPEVAAATASHLAAVAAARGIPAPLAYYNPYYYHHGLAYAAPTYRYAPAPLNPDGTVAHTPEYLAIAASHAAARYQ